MTTRPATFEEIAAALRRSSSVLVLSHIRPDGDAIGCQLALAHSLHHDGKQVTMWNEDGVPEKLNFLPGAERITPPPATPVGFDVVVAVDTSDFRRLGRSPEMVAGKAVWINIDHHGTNAGYGDIVHVDPAAPATGQILYDLIRQTGLPFTYDVADCLFVAISTDTGSFQYPSTTARTFEIAADLVKAGVDVGKLSQTLYENYPLRRIELLRSLLNRLQIRCDGRLASVQLPQAEVRRIGSGPADTEGLIDHIRAIHGVVVAAFFEETPEGDTRVSMRSKDPKVDVSTICAGFGGGGHPLASGARLPEPLDEATTKVLDATDARIRAAFDESSR